MSRLCDRRRLSRLRLRLGADPWWWPGRSMSPLRAASWQPFRRTRRCFLSASWRLWSCQELSAGGTFEVFRPHGASELLKDGSVQHGFLEVSPGQEVEVLPNTLEPGAESNRRSHYVYGSDAVGSRGWLPVVVFQQQCFFRDVDAFHRSLVPFFFACPGSCLVSTLLDSCSLVLCLRLLGFLSRNVLSWSGD